MRNHASGTDDKRTVNGRRLLLAVALSVGFGVAAGFATAWLLGAVAPEWATTTRLGAVISAEVYLGVVAAHVIASGGAAGVRERLRLGRTTLSGVGLAIVVWAATWAIAVAANLALDPLTGSFDEFRRALAFVGSDGGRLAGAGALIFTLSAVRAVVLVPLAEEMFFRGALFGWLRRRLNAAATILLTAVLFAAMHAMPGLLTATFVVGLGAGWVRERTGSTTPYLVAHALNSLTLFGATYLLTGWTVPA